MSKQRGTRAEMPDSAGLSFHLITPRNTEVVGPSDPFFLVMYLVIRICFLLVLRPGFIVDLLLDLT